MTWVSFAQRGSALLLWMLAISGCSSEPMCKPGSERCRCDEGQCEAGLECRSSLCVAPVDSGLGTGAVSAQGGTEAAAGNAPNIGGGGSSPVPNGPARLKFCSEVSIDGADATLRITVLDKVFDALTLECSECQELPSGILLDFEILVVPDAISLGEFSQVVDPGEHVWLATVSGGEATLMFGKGRDGALCEDLDPFE